MDRPSFADKIQIELDKFKSIDEKYAFLAGIKLGLMEAEYGALGAIYRAFDPGKDEGYLDSLETEP